MKTISTVSVAVVSAAAGAAGAYFLTKRHIENKAQAEILDIRNTYAAMRDKLVSDLTRSTVPTTEELEEASEKETAPERLDAPLGVVVDEEVLEYADRVEREGYTHYSNKDVHPPRPQDLKVINVFDQDGPNNMAEAAGHDHVDEPEEEGEPNKDYPYIIDTQAFMEETLVPFGDAEQYHDKITLTYFEKDDTLCDESESPIPDVETIIGSDALSNFGRKSEDTNIVYIRNHAIATDFEIIRDRRSFATVVHGIPDDEDEGPRVRKFRESD